MGGEGRGGEGRGGEGRGGEGRGGSSHLSLIRSRLTHFSTNLTLSYCTLNLNLSKSRFISLNIISLIYTCQSYFKLHLTHSHSFQA